MHHTTAPQHGSTTVLNLQTQKNKQPLNRKLRLLLWLFVVDSGIVVVGVVVALWFKMIESTRNQLVLTK
jgi:hypothetical protein